MAICCWRFSHPILHGDINIAVLGGKRAREFSADLEELTTGRNLTKALASPPSTPIRHVDGGRPYDGGNMCAFESLEIEATAHFAPEMTIEIVGPIVHVGIPTLLLPQLAALISDSVRLQLADDMWMSALIADADSSIVEGRLRVWTWTTTGLVIGG